VLLVRSGFDALGLLGFGIVFGCCYASFLGLTAGAIVGTAILFYLGPFLTALAPFVTSKWSLLAVVSGTGFFFAILWDTAIQVAAPQLAAISDAEEGEGRENVSLNILQFFIPLLALIYLQDFSSVRLHEGGMFGALTMFFASMVFRSTQRNWTCQAATGLEIHLHRMRQTVIAVHERKSNIRFFFSPIPSRSS
jgi:hypothetical protein